MRYHCANTPHKWCAGSPFITGFILQEILRQIIIHGLHTHSSSRNRNRYKFENGQLTHRNVRRRLTFLLRWGVKLIMLKLNCSNSECNFKIYKSFTWQLNQIFEKMSKINQKSLCQTGYPLYNGQFELHASTKNSENRPSRPLSCPD